MSQLIGRREWIQEVGDAEACTEHRRSLAREVVGQPDTRSNVAVAGLYACAAAHSILTGKDEDQLCEIEVRQLVVLFSVRREDVVAKSDIERQTGGSLPIVLKEARELLVGDVVRNL